MTVHQRLHRLMLEVFELPADTEVSGLRYRSTAGWDSVGHMRLVAALETEFGVLLETGQILDLSDFQAGMEILKAHGLAD